MSSIMNLFSRFCTSHDALHKSSLLVNTDMHYELYQCSYCLNDNYAGSPEPLVGADNGC